MDMSGKTIADLMYRQSADGSKFTNKIGAGAGGANTTSYTGTIAVANGSCNTVLTSEGWKDVSNSFLVSNGPVIASDFIKLKPKTFLNVYDLKVVDLRHSASRDEAARIKLNVVGACIEVAEGKSAQEAIKLRHAADFAKIQDIEYMSVLITNLNTYEIEQKVD